MRELKFRAWDKVGKKMWKVSSMKFFGEKGDFDLQVEGNEDEEWEKEPEFTVMQYTQMKDKNGREIYEGDICHYIDYYCGDHLYKSGVGEVVFDEGAFHVREATELNSAEISNLEYRVIGNVYQNPELAR